ncbi:hypothetical protein [Mycobacteroides abscessus]|uniref:hypothetical protein n=1 Tax=Mycobacteroides abscessus TaxID=36809 RepID=UPI000258563A|nr:hypothetical protein [Mycobacteroides abscessus]EIC63007.1 hypothetical protein OUW_17526 [Mycobacteroides abscessus M93]
MIIENTDFWSATPELTTIYQWARARYAAPWAVFGAVLLRVSASAGPHVQLPGIIGGRASLNLLAAFVSASGGGKGISDKVAREVWPAPIIERPIGSGEGIAATFMPPKKEGQEPIARAIFSVPEVDTLAGLAGRQGSILLAQLKSMAMGELLGQSNASDATTRIVQPHTYRCCLSVGAQPGHCGVIFSDASGGTPQRFLWFPTTDPDMPATPAADPVPLDTALPLWARTSTDVVEIQYGPEEIAQTVIAAHIARQRGDSDALDGHALLTRLKVAAVLAVMHHRSVVCELDWQLSETVMAVSTSTRDWILTEAKRAERAKVRDKAVARAVGDDFYDASRLETVKRSMLRMLERDGEQPEGKLKARLGTREKRDLFEQASALLTTEGLVSSREYEYNGRRITVWSTMTTVVNHEKPSSETMTTVVNHDQPATVSDLDSHRSHDSEQEQMDCRARYAQLVHTHRNQGDDTINSLAVYELLQAEGHAYNTIKSAVSESKLTHPLRRDGHNVVWCLRADTCDHPPARSADQWLLEWFPANSGNDGLSAADVVAAGAREAEEYTKDAITKAKQRLPQIVSTGAGRSARWIWSTTTEGESA